MVAQLSHPVPLYISHPQASHIAALAVRLTCQAYNNLTGDRRLIDVLIPLAFANNLNEITKLIRHPLGREWVVVRAIQTGDRF